MFFTNPFTSRDIAPPLAGPVVTENNLCAPYVSALETPFLERMYQNPRRSSTSTMLNMQQLAADHETIEGGKTEDNFPLGPTVWETFKDFRRQKDRRKKEGMSKACPKQGTFEGTLLLSMTAMASQAAKLEPPRYRMHPSIRSFPSAQFYESMLEDQVSIPHRPQLNCIWPQKKEPVMPRASQSRFN